MIGHRLEYALFRVLRAVVSGLPEGAAARLAATLGWVVGVVLRVRRSDVDRHLALAFPDRSPPERARLARESYRHLAREGVVLFRLGGWPNDRILERTQVEGLGALREALDRAGGALLLTGHLGNWEVGGAALAARGIAIDVVAKGMANRRFEEDLFGARARLGMRVVRMSEAPREVLRSLRSGRVVAIVGDQSVRRNGVFVPFFGRPAPTARGAAVFALRTGVPVFVGFALREPGWRHRYTIRLRRLDFRRSGDFERDVETFLGAYMEEVEAAARSHPGQYFWQHRRWRVLPPEEPSADAPVTTSCTTEGAARGGPTIAREGHEP